MGHANQKHTKAKKRYHCELLMSLKILYTSVQIRIEIVSYVEFKLKQGASEIYMF